MKKRLPIVIGLAGFIGMAIVPNLFVLWLTIIVFSIIAAWVAEITLIEKLAFTILPFLLLYPIKHIVDDIKFNYHYITSQRVDVIFPENFTGNALIITNKECGEELIKDKFGFEKYYIPEDGILFHKEGMRDFKEFHYKFRFFKVIDQDTVEIPYKNRDFVDWETDKYYAATVDGIMDKKNHYQRIQFYVCSTQEKIVYDTAFLHKNYFCK